MKGWNPSHVPMAQKLDLSNVLSKFAAARFDQTKQMDPLEIVEMDDQQQYWLHDGKLFARTWWTAQGWHYGEWTGTNWKCPDSGETRCPWEEGEKVR